MSCERKGANVIKVVMCVRRKPEMDAAAFHRYWREEHGPLVKSLAEATGALRYVQSHAIAPERNAAMRKGRGAAEAYDGIAEVWFESLEAVTERFRSEEARAADRAMAADESRFIDLGRSCVFFTEEAEVF